MHSTCLGIHLEKACGRMTTEINILTNNIGLWPQGDDDVPDETSPADALHNSEGGMLVPYDAK